MLVEGKNAVLQSIKSGQNIIKIYIDKNYLSRKDEIISLAAQHKIKVEFLPKNVLDKKSKTAHHQGYIAQTVDFVYCSIEDILKRAKDKNEKPFIVLLDGIEDPHNLGAIIRSCECGGVHGIIIPKDRACQVNETVIRTSTGAIANMPIARVTNLKMAIEELQKLGIWIYAAEAGGKNIYSINLDTPLALIIGSEGFGIKKSILNMADEIVSLPLKGEVNSLNASVACGVAIYEVVRQRLK